MEQVRFKSGMEERGSDGWCDVCFRNFFDVSDTILLRSDHFKIGCGA